mmetsp:Transcript_5830/g.9968  ORF Transcript_5830/g.9968 Transcript_5830/m.9968 type:complete len:87 (-) Transcript_5830:142-402(-)
MFVVGVEHLLFMARVAIEYGMAGIPESLQLGLRDRKYMQTVFDRRKAKKREMDQMHMHTMSEGLVLDVNSVNEIRVDDQISSRKTK